MNYKTRVKHITKRFDSLYAMNFEDVINRELAKIEGDKGEIIGVSHSAGEEWDSAIITYITPREENDS